MKTALRINQLKKAYGQHQAVKQISFEVQEGCCYGLLGPNGAGKSTTMKIVSCILEPDSGTVEVFGRNAVKQSSEVRKMIGYVPQNITLYDKLSAYDNLLFFGEMFGLKGLSLKKRIQDVLEQVGLSDRAKDAVHTFSGGMARRINIAASLLHQPKLLILDEPTVGIDPQSRNHIFEMIRQLNRDGVTVIYSTHYMEEVETLCDQLAIIDHGNVIAEGRLQELLSRYGTKSVYVESVGQQDIPLSALQEPFSRSGAGWIIQTDNTVSTIREVSELCLKQSVSVQRLEIVRPSLETVFLTLTGTSLRDS
jgi:ABC-2 type transport system ATP-binding protein